MDTMASSNGQNDKEAGEYDNLTADDWTLFDKMLYGGFGYSEFCMPSNILIIALTVIYPPLGMIAFLVHKTFTPYFPFITARTFINLFTHFELVVKSIIYTMLLYIPGIIFTFSNMNFSNAAV
jgi:uncharacterized membrane protein YqaE (UPF0057 family)